MPISAGGGNHIYCQGCLTLSVSALHVWTFHDAVHRCAIRPGSWQPCRPWGVPVLRKRQIPTTLAAAATTHRTKLIAAAIPSVSAIPTAVCLLCAPIVEALITCTAAGDPCFCDAVTPYGPICSDCITIVSPSATGIASLLSLEVIGYESDYPPPTITPFATPTSPCRSACSEFFEAFETCSNYSCFCS